MNLFMNMIFPQMKLETIVIPHFHVNLTGQSISEIILIIQGHLQGVIEHDELLRVFSFTQPTTKYKNQPKIRP